MSRVQATRTFQMSVDRAYKFCLFFFTMQNPNPTSCGSGRLPPNEAHRLFAQGQHVALVEWDYPTRFVVDKPQPGSIGRTEMQFRPSDRGVDVTWIFSVHPIGFAGRVFTAVVRWQMARTKGEADFVVGNLMRLKTEAEQTDPGLEEAFGHFQSQLAPRSTGLDSLAADETVAEVGRALVDCAAFYNVVALSQPDQAAVDMASIANRDFFADLGRRHLEAFRGRSFTSGEFAGLLDDAIEEFERKHRSGDFDRVARTMASYCGACQHKVTKFVGDVGPLAYEQAGPAALRTLLRELSISDESSKATVDSPSSVHHDTVLRAFQLWAERGYMTPRKARRNLGIK